MLEEQENKNDNNFISNEVPISLSGKTRNKNLPNLQKNPIQTEKPSSPKENPVNTNEIESLKNNSTFPSIEPKSDNEKVGESIINLSGKTKEKKDFTEKKRRRRNKCSYSSKKSKKSKNKSIIPPLINLSKNVLPNPQSSIQESNENLILKEFHSSNGAIKFDPNIDAEQIENNKTAKKKSKISEKERIANAEKEFMEKLNQEYSDEQYNKDLSQILKEEKNQFMQKNFPIMYRKDKYYLYSILLNKRRTQPIHFINPNSLSNSIQESKKLQTLYLNEELEKGEINNCENLEEEKNNNNFKKQSIDNNTEEEQLEHIKKNLTEKEDENRNKNINKDNKFISPQKKKDKKGVAGMSDTSPSETDGKNNENNQSIDESGDKIYGLKFKKIYDVLPKHIWSMPEEDKELDVELFFEDCIQMWPFTECRFIKEIALEFLMMNNYSTDICFKREKDFVSFMKKRAKELDFSLVNKNEKTVKNYSLRKTKNN